MVMNPDFRECIELLNAHDVRYLLVGGHALAVHGHPGYTKDLDIWIDRSEQNASRLVEALTAFGFGSTGLDRADFLERDRVIQLGYEPSRIGLLTGLDGVEFDSCYLRRAVVAMEGPSVPFIDRDCLILNKRATGRPQDLVDADLLEGSPPEPGDVP